MWSECLWGATDPNLEAVEGESVARSLCQVRAAARQVIHGQDLRVRLGMEAPPFPLLPSLSGDVVTNAAVAGAIDEAVWRAPTRTAGTC